MHHSFVASIACTGACAETTLFLLSTELKIALKVSLMIHLTNQCLSVVQSEKCFICGFPEIVVSSMVKQTILHANCFSGVSLTFKVV